MNLTDMILLALSNLWRTKLRTILTILGVVIGIGALTSMVSFGTGLQKNITDAFTDNDLFTSITVTPKKIDFDEIAAGNTSQFSNSFRTESTPLTDSMLRRISAIPGVEIAYPNSEFPSRVRFLADSAVINVGALPAAIGQYKPFNDLLAGTFFTSDSAACLIIREEVLESKFRIKLLKEGQDVLLSKADSLKGTTLMHPDSLIGKLITLISMSVNPAKVPMVMFGMMSNKPVLPFDEAVINLTICGILKRRNEFSSNVFNGGMIVPIATAARIPKLGFNSVWDLLGGKNQEGTYSSIHVRVAEMKKMDEVKISLEAMNVGVFTIADQLQEIKRGFLIVNSVLGAIGAIALIVAGLGIINTMLMSILERTREIGIMKAIGGSEKEIRMIFFTEAATIGFIGAMLGLVLGWLVTKVANVVVNTQLAPEGVDPVNLFYFPLWLILGAIAFSMLVSLAAGLYPAIRASRIDPVKALRHD